ncbi:hypothetical protein H5410_041469 [Solanum commersonii]|uniref:Putative plant transposon protein domain-containing protein n=1 Tax=Solanum commersonii TaxID=4109 RepID=A0A9J5XRP2_SOLCO|nr:hypothetical protein H5410_041469 [Solanum commersonii]
MVQWTKHITKRFHQSLSYAQMSRETRVWLKIVVNFLIPGLYYTDITRDRVCLVYALMTNTELNIGVVLKSTIRKARVHKRSGYAFRGIITRLCHSARITEKNLDYMVPLFPASMDITKTKGADNEFGPPLTTLECHRRDELIMDRMYGLEMLHHQNGCRVSTEEQLGAGIDSEFHEPVDDDIPTEEDRLHTGSDVDSDSDTEEVDPTQAGDEAEGGDAMED